MDLQLCKSFRRLTERAFTGSLGVYWCFWCKAGCCVFSKCHVAGAYWKIRYLDGWGNTSETFQQLLPELPTLVTVLSWSSVKPGVQAFPRMLTARTPWGAGPSATAATAYCSFAHPLSGSEKWTVQRLHAGGLVGVGIGFSHVPIQNKVFLKAHCLTLRNGEMSTWPVSERVYLLGRKRRKGEK